MRRLWRSKFAKRLLSWLVAKHGYRRVPVWALALLLVTFGPVAGGHDTITQLTETAADSLSNWADVQSVIMAIGPVASETVADSNAANWADPAKTVKLYYSVTVDDATGLDNWDDTTVIEALGPLTEEVGDDLANWDDGATADFVERAASVSDDLNGWADEVSADICERTAEVADTLDNWLDEESHEFGTGADVTFALANDLANWLDDISTDLVSTQLTKTVSSSLNSWADSASAELTVTEYLESVADNLSFWIDPDKTVRFQWGVTVPDATGLNYWSDGVAIDNSAVGNVWHVGAGDTLANWGDVLAIGRGLRVSDANGGQQASPAATYGLSFEGTFADDLNSWQDTHGEQLQSTVQGKTVEVQDACPGWSDAINRQLGTAPTPRTVQVSDKWVYHGSSNSWLDSIHVSLGPAPKVFDDLNSWSDVCSVQVANTTEELGEAPADDANNWDDDLSILLEGYEPNVTYEFFDDAANWQDGVNAQLTATLESLGQTVSDTWPAWTDDHAEELQGVMEDKTVSLQDACPAWSDFINRELIATLEEISYELFDDPPTWLDEVNVQTTATLQGLGQAASDAFPDWLDGLNYEVQGQNPDLTLSTISDLNLWQDLLAPAFDYGISLSDEITTWADSLSVEFGFSQFAVDVGDSLDAWGDILTSNFGLIFRDSLHNWQDALAVGGVAVSDNLDNWLDSIATLMVSGAGEASVRDLVLASTVNTSSAILEPTSEIALRNVLLAASVTVASASLGVADTVESAILSPRVSLAGADLTPEE